MIPNCKGCEEELSQACYHQEEEGLNLATCPFKKGHFHLIMVDDQGKQKVN